MRKFLFSGQVMAMLLAVYSAKSCPHCNIHNYLASSVYNSKVIVYGKVVETGKEKAKIRVFEVIKGDTVVLPSDSVIEWTPVYATKGETAVFLSGYSAFGLSFSILSPQSVHEIRYITGKDSLPADDKTALYCIKGMSGEAVEGALDYFRKFDEETFAFRKAMLDTLFNRVPGNVSGYNEWETRNILNAFFTSCHAETEQWLPARVVEFFKDYAGDSLSGIWKSHRPGILLYGLLESSSKYADVHDAIAGIYTRYLHVVKGEKMRAVAFALLKDKGKTAEEIAAITGKETDPLAEALLDCSYSCTRWWDWKNAKRYTRDAEKYAINKETKKKVEEEMKYIGRWTKWE